MESINELLSNIEAQYEQQQKKTEPKETLIDDCLTELQANIGQQQPSKSSKGKETLIDNSLAQFQGNIGQQQPSKSSKGKETLIDDSLAQFQGNLSQQKPASKASSGNLDNVLNQVQTKFSNNQPTNHKSSNQGKLDDSFFQDLEQKFQQKKQVQQESVNEERIEDIQRQEQEKQRKAKILRQKAETWLKRLDTNSEEGLWFAEFAYTYESKIEAAMDYLAALDSR